jgi:hypothetical protein
VAVRRARSGANAVSFPREVEATWLEPVFVALVKGEDLIAQGRRILISDGK